jgi:murein DD-endopeptidase MepM/ murein hydrolase activator NlpD
MSGAPVNQGKLRKAWLNPVKLTLVATGDSLSFKDMKPGETGLPLGPDHPGSFGFVRKHHVHEGVDLYTEDGAEVSAVEDGVVVNIEPFTGPKAGYPHWLDTDAVLVEGESGVVVYGEITPRADLKIGQRVIAGELVGNVVPVLRNDKGRPRIMLHMELHEAGTPKTYEWTLSPDGDKMKTKPPSLRDPTPLLLPLARPK